MEKHGEKKWSIIAQLVKGRIGKQCRERWHNHLRPDIKVGIYVLFPYLYLFQESSYLIETYIVVMQKDVWTEEEDRVLIEGHAEMGNKWAEIAKRLPGRTENSIKNHWNATKRRQLSGRKCRTKSPRPNSLLHNYIKSLITIEKGSSSSSSISRNISNDDVSEMDFHNMVQDYEIDDVPV